MKQLIWRTRDGYNYKVKEMDTPHIWNALAMLKRIQFYDRDNDLFINTTKLRAFSRAFIDELRQRGELVG